MADPWLLLLTLSILPLLAYAVYYSLLPKPLAGIPYHQEATRSLLGDMPAMLSHIQQTGEMFSWLGQQCTELQSPLVQVFTRPLSKPWLVLCDFRETQDILLRRTKDFDRSSFTADLFAGLLPDHHIRLATDDPEFRKRRRLGQDLMTPGFLQAVAGPHIYNSAMNLVHLWEQKLQICKSRPFDASRDICHFSLDAVLAFTFGYRAELNATQAQLDYMTSQSGPTALEGEETPKADNDRKPFKFDEGPQNADIEALQSLSHSLETSLKAPFPKLAHWFLRQTSAYKQALLRKENLISRMVREAESRAHDEKEQKHPRLGAAVDSMVRRENELAERESRPPDVHSRIFSDELYGFLLAGHDTLSTSQLWALKLLARHPTSQDKLRTTLQTSLRLAHTEHRSPTASEILKLSCPYLDACIEELFRVSLTTPAIVRTAKRDTTVLGGSMRVPRGTEVVMVWNGSGMQGEGKEGEEEREDFLRFEPERWITTTAEKEEEGIEGRKEVFNPNPSFKYGGGGGGEGGATATMKNMIFSLGPRACFGRKLAYLEFRIWLVLVVWNFRFLGLDGKGGGSSGLAEGGEKGVEDRDRDGEDDEDELLDTDRAWDRLTRVPRECYVRLERVGHE